MSDEDSLAQAILRLRLAEPSMSTKKIHAALVLEAAWRETQLSEVRRACSKLAKREARSTDPHVYSEALRADSSDVPPVKVKARVCWGCGATEAKSVWKECQKCIDKGLPHAYFCSPECFEANMPRHIEMHRAQKTTRKAMVSQQAAEKTNDWAAAVQELCDDGCEIGVLVTTANLHMEKGEYKRADKYLRKAMELSPDDPMVMYSHGKLRHQTGEWTKALRSYAEVIRMADPSQKRFQGVWADALTNFFGMYMGDRSHPNMVQFAQEPAPLWWNKVDLLRLSARAVEIVEHLLLTEGIYSFSFGPAMEMRATVLMSGACGEAFFNDKAQLWPSRAELREAVRLLQRSADAVEASGKPASEKKRLLFMKKRIAAMAEDPDHDKLRYEAATELWPPQTPVVIQGLTSRPALNGTGGVVLGWDASSSRYLVKPNGAAASIKLRVDSLGPLLE